VPRHAKAATEDTEYGGFLRPSVIKRHRNLAGRDRQAINLRYRGDEARQRNYDRGAGVHRRDRVHASKQGKDRQGACRGVTVGEG